MAKFALVGYGSDGRGLGKTTDGYTYVVNDNVRTKDVIQVISTSSNNKKFATTGMVNHAYKELSAKGQEAKQEVQKLGKDVTQSYTGKELGVSGSKTPQKSPEGLKSISSYTQQTRAGNIAKELQKNPTAQLTSNAKKTFDEYSKQFMKKGE